MTVRPDERIEIFKKENPFWRRYDYDEYPPINEWIVYLNHIKDTCNYPYCDVREHFTLHSGYYEKKKGFIQAFTGKIIKTVRYWALAEKSWGK